MSNIKYKQNDDGNVGLFFQLHIPDVRNNEKNNT